MKYIKLYEELNINEPEVGDYVIINNDIFIHTNDIGRIRSLPTETFTWYFIDFINNSGVKSSSIVTRRYIEYWSKYKEDLEDVLAAKNFNL